MKRQAALVATLVVIAIVSILLISYWPDRSGVSDDNALTGHPPRNTTFGFGEAFNLTNNTQDSVYGQVVAVEDKAYVVWQDSLPSAGSSDARYSGRNYDIFMTRSSDGGQLFGSPVNVSNNPGFSEHPQAAASLESLYVVWADNTSGNREILFTKVENDAADFGATMNLSNSPSDSSNQEIAAFGDNVYIVWIEEGNDGAKVLFRASDDGGRTFNEPLQVSDKANTATLPKIAAGYQSVHIAWSLIDDQNESGLYYLASNDGGSSFIESKRLNSEANIGEPQIVVNNGTVYVIYSLGAEALNGVFLAASFDGGGNFATHSMDANGTFINPLNVEAVLDEETGVLYVAGQVFVSGNEEILLLPIEVQSNMTKELGIANLSGNEKISECPSIAIAGENILVVWEDLTPGNHEILYARGLKV